MYFNFEENHPDTPRLESSLTVLERVLLTTVLYLVVVILALVLPRTEWYKALLLQQEQARQRLQELQEQQAQQRERARFVFMSPRVEIQTPTPPDRAELSDLDRRASAKERARDPQNSLPFARGNTVERVDDEMSNGPREPRLVPTPSAAARGESENSAAVPLPDAPNAAAVRQPIAERPQTRGSSTGILADAIRNVQKYAGSETFHNPQGVHSFPNDALPI